MYIAIVKAENNRIVKFQEYPTQAEAQAHVDRLKDKFPDAFAYDNAANTPLRDLWIKGQTITVVPVVKTTEELRLEELESIIKADTIVNSFKTMTNAQFDTWWDANVTNAAQAIGVLKRLTKLVIRRLL